MAYDPSSSDAMFSRILTNQEAQNDALSRIEERQINFEAQITARVASLEESRIDAKARVGAIAFMVSLATGLVTWIAQNISHK